VPKLRRTKPDLWHPEGEFFGPHSVFGQGACEVSGKPTGHSRRTGVARHSFRRPLAILESSYLTALRTGLAGALGAGALALPSAERAAITGAGVQGRSQLAALRMVRSVASVRVFDLSGDAARRFLADPACAGLNACASSMDDALDDAQIVITATWAREPLLLRRHLKPGMHITTLGPDQPGKCEVSAEALLAVRVVVDDRKLALEMGTVGGAGLGLDCNPCGVGGSDRAAAAGT